jgi:serine protease Do
MKVLVATTQRARRAIVAATVALVMLAATAANTPAQNVIGPVVQGQDRPLHTLRDLNQAFVELVADVKPSVVTVSTERVMSVQDTSPFQFPFSGDSFFDQFFGPQQPRGQDEPRERQYRQRGLGSGVIISSNGYILTNNHVVQNADSIYVRTSDDRRHLATVIGADSKTDLAVLRIDADNLKPIAVGNSDDLQVGEIVMAVGSPMSENLAYSVTQGIVSAKGRSNVGLADYEDFIQTDAAINPGNSGGPLVNLDGELVGINTAIVSQSGGFQGIGFAVPVNMAIYVKNSLINDGEVIRGWLGVMIQNVDEALAEAFDTKSTEGVLVSDVVKDGPAATAGFAAGDIILMMNGVKIGNTAQLRNVIASTPPGTKVDFTVFRDGQRLTLAVELGRLPDDPVVAAGGSGLDDLLGFSISTLTGELARRYEIGENIAGVVVTAIGPASAAYRAGLREGDVIVSVDKRAVKNRQDFTALAGDRKKGERILLRIWREGGTMFIVYTL